MSILLSNSLAYLMVIRSWCFFLLVRRSKEQSNYKFKNKKIKNSELQSRSSMNSGFIDSEL